MKFTETNLSGVYLIEMEPHVDDRGYFARFWCEEEFRDHGLNPNIAQINTIFSHQRGTLRGIHFQHAPHAEAKFVRCLRGSAFDIAVDLRAGSPTFKQHFAVELKAGDGKMLYVAEGCGHAFLTLEDETEVSYQSTTAFAPSAATGVRFDDPAFGIDWPIPVDVISDVDRGRPDFTIEHAFQAEEDNR